MYTNKHAWTNKDGTYKEVYYYITIIFVVEISRSEDIIVIIKHR